MDAIRAYRVSRSSNPSSMDLSLADAQAISDYHWAQQDPSIRPAKAPVVKAGDTAQLWGVPLTITDRAPGVAVLDGQLGFLLQLSVQRPVVAGLSQASMVNEERRETRQVGNPPTSNMSSHTLANLLLANPDGPVLVLFDNQAGCASELYVLTHLSDGPDWADPNTIYIDAHGG